ncbi:hypothetical protein PPERSA_01477 [Pseudocohnilembus persalinus]|uniref:Uncharacterized protein n=1 Tax=Pseudocohnilembus persalinus TaxID=266149 RepID=A0A0V0QHD8_PSEPJ|nr:hypothetical protein PPERSA_01477 [Pseudocohnilembus persalinus]|eukprot:KRX01574.1 hypothetical protein PPERSA_01477 [Pseudocohnilembus persalinus]
MEEIFSNSSENGAQVSQQNSQKIENQFENYKQMSGIDNQNNQEKCDNFNQILQKFQAKKDQEKNLIQIKKEGSDQFNMFGSPQPKKSAQFSQFENSKFEDQLINEQIEEINQQQKTYNIMIQQQDQQVQKSFQNPQSEKCCQKQEISQIQKERGNSQNVNQNKFLSQTESQQQQVQQNLFDDQKYQADDTGENQISSEKKQQKIIQNSYDNNNNDENFKDNNNKENFKNKDDGQNLNQNLDQNLSYNDNNQVCNILEKDIKILQNQDMRQKEEQEEEEEQKQQICDDFVMKDQLRQLVWRCDYLSKEEFNQKLKFLYNFSPNKWTFKDMVDYLNEENDLKYAKQLQVMEKIQVKKQVFIGDFKDQKYGKKKNNSFLDEEEEEDFFDDEDQDFDTDEDEEECKKNTMIKKKQKQLKIIQQQQQLQQQQQHNNNNNNQQQQMPLQQNQIDKNKGESFMEDFICLNQNDNYDLNFNEFELQQQFDQYQYFQNLERSSRNSDSSTSSQSSLGDTEEDEGSEQEQQYKQNQKKKKSLLIKQGLQLQCGYQYQLYDNKEEGLQQDGHTFQDGQYFETLNKIENEIQDKKLEGKFQYLDGKKSKNKIKDKVMPKFVYEILLNELQIEGKQKQCHQNNNLNQSFSNFGSMNNSNNQNRSNNVNNNSKTQDEQISTDINTQDSMNQGLQYYAFDSDNNDEQYLQLFDTQVK